MRKFSFDIIFNFDVNRDTKEIAYKANIRWNPLINKWYYRIITCEDDYVLDFYRQLDIYIKKNNPIGFVIEDILITIDNRKRVEFNRDELEKIKEIYLNNKNSIISKKNDLKK